MTGSPILSLMIFNFALIFNISVLFVEIYVHNYQVFIMKFIHFS